MGEYALSNFPTGHGLEGRATDICRSAAVSQSTSGGPNLWSLWCRRLACAMRNAAETAAPQLADDGANPGVALRVGVAYVSRFGRFRAWTSRFPQLRTIKTWPLRRNPALRIKL